MSTINLSPDYHIVCAGEAVASFKTLEDARKAMANQFANRIGVYIQYPIGALKRDHLVAKRLKEKGKW